MTYLEALKKVQTAKTSDSYWVVKVAYDYKLILPHKAGIAFMDAMAQAEQLNDRYSEQANISPIDRERLTIEQMSRTEYEQYKIAGLLNLSINSVKEAAMPKAEELVAPL